MEREREKGREGDEIVLGDIIHELPILSIVKIKRERKKREGEREEEEREKETERKWERKKENEREWERKREQEGEERDNKREREKWNKQIKLAHFRQEQHEKSVT